MNTAHVYLPSDVINGMTKELDAMVKKVDHIIEGCLASRTPRIKVSTIPELMYIGKQGYERDIVPTYGDSVKWSVIDGENYLEFSV